MSILWQMGNHPTPMSQARMINASEIVNFITDFAIRQGQIRYRIVLHLIGGETLLFADFGRYEQYKQAWTRLHEAKQEEMDLLIQR